MRCLRIMILERKKATSRTLAADDADERLLASDAGYREPEPEQDGRHDGPAAEWQAGLVGELAGPGDPFVEGVPVDVVEWPVDAAECPVDAAE